MTVHVTQGAEGLSRRAFTVADIERMIATGIIAHDENFELIEGEIVPMAAKYHAHERVKSALNLAIARTLPDDLWLGVESSIRLSEKTVVEPDLAIYPKMLRLEEVKGPDILLAIEVADTTLAYDKGVKAQLYAAYGVRELWVIDANERRTWVHRGPTALGWGSVVEVPPHAELRPEVPGLYLLSVRLADID
jgi:Uma2 family endonuclease